MNTFPDNNINQHSMPSDNIDISDIANLLQIIDLASKRGAFAGNELGKIGAIYDKVANVINKYTKSDQKNVI